MLCEMRTIHIGGVWRDQNGKRGRHIVILLNGKKQLNTGLLGDRVIIV